MLSALVCYVELIRRNVASFTFLEHCSDKDKRRKAGFITPEFSDLSELATTQCKTKRNLITIDYTAQLNALIDMHRRPR